MSKKFLSAKAILIILLLIISLIQACTLSSNNGRVTQTPSTKKSTAQITTQPMETAFPSTPEQLVDADAPLIILDSSSGFYLFTEDGDQIGKIDVRNLAPSGYFLERTISPSGGWIAWRNFQNSEDIATLTLNVAQLSDPDHPRRIPLMAQEESTNIQIRETSRNAIITGVGMRWSPDGRRLAFVAELETPVANLYVFDTQTGKINRLTDSSKTLMILSWTPDGSSILYEEVESCGGGGCEVIAVWGAPIDGNTPRKLYDVSGGNGEVLAGFASKDHVLMISTNPVGPIRLRMVGTTSGESQSLFNAPFSDAAVDPKSGTILVTVPTDTGKTSMLPEKAGSYQLDLSSQHTIWVQTGNWAETEWLPEANQFLSKGSLSEPAQLMTPDGKITEFPTETGLGGLHTRISPDGTKLTFYNDTGLRIYTNQAKLIDTVEVGPIQSFVWNSDSTGGLFISEGILYKVDTAHPNQPAQIVLKINDLKFNSQLVLIRGNGL